MTATQWLRIRSALGVALSIALLGGSAPASAAGPVGDGRAPIAEAALRDAATKGADSIAYVILREQADVDRAFAIADWDERGQYVYDQLTRTAGRTQVGLLRHLAARGIAATPFWIVNAVAIQGADAETLRTVAARAEVARIEADAPASIDPIPPAPDATGDTTTAAPTVSTEWGIAETRAPSVWSQYGVRGEGVIVGTIDSGVLYTHPALVASYRGNLGNGTFNHDYDWYDGVGGCTAAPCDAGGHGTHTMGTIVGEDGSNRIGMAPKARWIAARGCSTSSCSSTALLNSGQWMLAPRPVGAKNGGQASLRPQIVSNSWGSSAGGSTTYQTMVNNWVAAGIFPVFSNGNNGTNGCSTVGSPGSYVNAYGVGAYDVRGAIAYFSSRGVSPFASEVKPDISAPGVNVRSSWNNGGYNTISGTSMAAPHVAGAVVLLLSAAPSLVGQVGRIRSYLDGSARSVSDNQCGGSAGDNNVWGKGKLDIYASVTAAPRGAVGTLAGSVKGSDAGAAIGGASVAATANGVTRTVVTDSSGLYSITLPVGTYSIAVSRFGYVAASLASQSIAENATSTLAVTLTPLTTYTLTGTVVSNLGAPVAGASVSIDAALPAATTSETGAFSIPGVPIGTYSLSAAPPNPCFGPGTATYGLTATSAAASLTMPVRSDAANHYCTLETRKDLSAATRSSLTGDDVVAAFALPWQVSWFGTRYGTIYVSTNGFASFASVSTAAYTSEPLPSLNAPSGGLFPFWTDLYIDGDAGIYTQTVGAAGSRRFIVEWRNALLYQTSDRVTFALALDEATGNVSFQYTTLGAAATQLGSVTSVGIERTDGKDGLQYSYRTPTLLEGTTIVWRTK